MGPCLFAAIADDYTGGSDLAGMLFEGGVDTIQIFGPRPPEFIRSLGGRCQAAVLSLKSRSIPAAEARRLSLEALDCLAPLDPAQIQFKYCSTFDSTPGGNIGPVADVLMNRLGVSFTIAVPALPVNHRTQYLGHLFVGPRLLSESHMRSHPINPMTDSNLVRVLQAQTPRKVGLIALPVVQSGAAAIRREMEALERDGTGIALVDAITDDDLARIAEAACGLRLTTGGSGLAMKLPDLWRAAGLLSARKKLDRAGTGARGTAVLSGSCSAATLAQLDELARTGCAMIRVDVPRLLADAASETARLYTLAIEAFRTAGRGCVYSSAPPEERRDLAESACRIEALFGDLARRLVGEGGVRNLVVAGGETAGAVVSALDIPAVEITGILDPGVPAIRSFGDPPLALALKSGNFGSRDFFDKAMRRLEDP